MSWGYRAREKPTAETEIATVNTWCIQNIENIVEIGKRDQQRTFETGSSVYAAEL